jgi:tRNA(Ile)-lysidine synthase
VTAHTEDDQAETLLMRLARGSGLDGLTGMSAERLIGPEAGCTLLRPLLGMAGARLKATLEARQLAWIEDPSNDCDRFERVRLRKARHHLEAIGLTNERIALSARRLERARAALEAAAIELQTAVGLDIHAGMYASFRARPFAAAPQEVRLRLLARLLAAFGGQDEPARLAKVESLLDRMSATSFEAATLGGCMVEQRCEEIWVLRESGRAPLPELVLAPGASAVWDRRFRVKTDAEIAGAVVVRALGGAGFASLRPQLKDALPPARAAAGLPAFWRDGDLVAVPSLSGCWSTPAALGRNSRLCSAEFLW